VNLGRRRFSLLTALAAVAGPRTLAATPAPDPGSVLALAAHALFPHESVSMARYRTAAEGFVAGNAAGALRLARALGGVGFLQLSPPQRDEVLRRQEASQDFLAFRWQVMVSLYSELAVTRDFGYEGPSLAQGGYLHRGFDDIDWLPGGDGERHGG
jgi:hypothetical protein